MLIDTHTHLYLPEFEPDSDGAVNRAVDAGVGMMIFPNVDTSTVGPMRALALRHPDNVRMAMGLHPTEVNADTTGTLDDIMAELHANAGQYCAVGEIGIDLYWDKTFVAEQMEAFERQCREAVRLGLPVIIHCRDGLDQTLEVLDGLDHRPCGVFHSFGGTADDVERIRRTGDFYFGINGIVTFKNSRLADTLPAIGLDRILLETDSPYLAPVPHRGRRNESSYLIHIAARVADALGCTMQQVEDATTYSARTLFNIQTSRL